MAQVELKFNNKRAIKFMNDILSQSDSVKDKKKKYIGIISPLIFKDIIRHFEKEEGPDGKWAPWSDGYKEQMNKIGKGGNKILQDTGQLRQGIRPTNLRTATKGIEFFNPAKTSSGFPYAAHHDETAKVTRSFMWLSDKALDKVSGVTLAFIVGSK